MVFATLGAPKHVTKPRTSAIDAYHIEQDVLQHIRGMPPPRPGAGVSGATRSSWTDLLLSGALLVGVLGFVHWYHTR